MSFYELPAALDDDIKAYEELVAGYAAGDVPKVKLKAFRVPMGIYEQREAEHYMMRIRLVGGSISPAQLKFIAGLAAEYSQWPLHFTTRQDVQIHDVKLADTITILRQLQTVGLSSRGGGGNTVRNIMADPDTGLDPEEVFDVAPYARALTTRLIAEPDSWTLPRKYKIAFSSSPADRGLATVNDLGFIACLNESGEKGFTVYAAGGMGRRARVGHRIYDFVPADDVYIIARALKNLFDKHGNRKQKHAARIRFLYEKLGGEEFVRRLESEIDGVRAAGYPALDVPEPAVMSGELLRLPLFLGDMDPASAAALADYLEPWGEETIRVDQNQNLVLLNIPASELEGLKAELVRLKILDGLNPFLGRAVACAGASTCKLGICLSRGLLQALGEELKDFPSHAATDEISLKISGCPNTCGQHSIADIGIFGGAKRGRNNPYPVYTLVTGGVVGDGITALAERVASVPARRVPVLLREFLEEVQKGRNDNETFRDYLQRCGKAQFEKLAGKHSAVPEIEADPQFYQDWYADKTFSLSEKLEGECSAGLFDLIELDLGLSAEALTEAEKAPDAGGPFLHQAVVAASRALLMTKGLEAKDDTEVISLFREHFLGAHIGQGFSRLLDRHLAGAELALADVQGLLQAVRDLYDSMDDSLRFPEIDASRNVPTEEAAGAPEKQVKDFRGVACPMNFVRTKLVLETMGPGEILEVLLDDGEPIENVPPSVTEEGHTVLEKNKVEEYWSVIIQRKDD